MAAGAAGAAGAATLAWHKVASEPRLAAVSRKSVCGLMLHCNMNVVATQLLLEDLLADLRHARRMGDLGRLAFVAYCEVRRWARDVGETVLAERAADLVIASPFASRDVFLERADQLIQVLEQVRLAPGAPSSLPSPVSPRPDPRGA